jgi:hypothetical protein
MIRYHVVLLLGAILAGCGNPAPPPELAARKPEPAETVRAAVKTNGLPAPAAPVTQATAAVVSVVIPEPARMPAGAPDFEGRLAELNALISNTDFGEAIRLGREMQSAFQETEQYDRVADVLRRLAEYRRDAPPLVIAVRNLAAADSRMAQAAQDELEAADELGLIFLRHALRTQPAPAALAAAELLLALNDTEAIPVFMSHVKTNSVSPLGRASVRALAIMAKSLPPDVAPACFEIVRNDTTFGATPVFDILEAVFLRTCERDEARFNERVGCAEGTDVLRARLQAALLSTNAAARASACAGSPEFLPLMNGLRATYYADTTFGARVLDRNETQPRVEIASRAFPVPGGGVNALSARWSGDLLVRQAGEYVFTLQCGPSATQTTRLWVDEENLSAVDNWGNRGWQPQTLKKALSNGWHTVRLEYTKTNNTPDGSIRFVWAGPSAVMRSRPWPEEIDATARAISDLASTNATAVRAARDRLGAASDFGKLFLHDALKAGSGERAARVFEILTGMRDTDVVSVFLARLKTEKDATMIAGLTDALCELAGVIKPDVFPGLYRAALAPDAGEMNPCASILCAALLARQGDAEAFNTLVKDAQGYQALTRHVQAALASTSDEAVRRACLRGAPIAPVMPGLLGRYHAGQAFILPVLETVDPQVNVPNREFRFPDKRQDDISVRWTGFLTIRAPGSYTVIVNAHGVANVWVDDQLVAQSQGWAENRKDAVKLAAGWHKLRVDFWQASGYSQVQLSWIPPGRSREVIPAAVLKTPPAASLLAQIEKTVAGLPTAKPEELAAAAALLRSYGGVSGFYLDRALRRANPEGIAPLVTMLVEMRDVSLAGRIREMRKTSAPLAPKIDACLADLAVKGAPSQAPWFYAVMKADTDNAFPMCGPFLSKVMQETCKNDGNAFNALVGDPQGQATLKAFLDKMSKPNPK